MQPIRLSVNFCLKYRDGYEASTDGGGPIGYESEDGSLYCDICEEAVDGAEHFQLHTHGDECDSGIQVIVGESIVFQTPESEAPQAFECVEEGICVLCGTELDSEASCDCFCHQTV